MLTGLLLRLDSLARQGMLAISLIVLASNADAQAVVSTVTDRGTGKPVPDAYVKLVQHGRLMGAYVTGPSGGFAFESSPKGNISMGGIGFRVGDSIPPGEYMILVEALGYAKDSIKVTLQAGETTLLLSGVALVRSARPPTAADSAEAPRAVMQQFIRGLKFAPYVRGQVQTIIGKPGQALTEYYEALDRVTAAGDSFNLAETHGYIGDQYKFLGIQDSALVHYRRALEIQRRRRDRKSEARTLHRIGNAQEGDSAWINLNRALAMQRFTGDSSAADETAGRIALYLLSTGERDSAIVYFREVVRRRRARKEDAGGALYDLGYAFRHTGKLDSAIKYLEAARETQEPMTGETTFKAGIWAQLGVIHFLANTADPTRSAAYFDSATALYSSVTEEAGSDINSVVYAESKVPLYELWTMASAGRGALVGKDNAALAALAVSERGRAQGLRRLMGVGLGFKAGGDLVSEGRAASRAVESGAIALAYQVTDHGLLGWLISNDSVELFISNEGKRERIAELVEAFRQALLKDGRETRALGLAVSEIVFPKNLSTRLGTGSRLLIIPSGPLIALPFAALELSDGRRLGLSAAVTYAPSLRVLRELRNRKRVLTPATLPRSIVVGNPTMPEVPPGFGREVVVLRSLPWAEVEADSITRILGTPPALKGPQATEVKIRRQLARAPIVHLATHAHAYPEENRARLSFVALAQDSKRAQDGLLTATDILDDNSIRLSADLVVLSGCESGLGDLKQAEGMLGLQRAFLAKGARAVVTSLWKVSDKATAALMTSFYREWYKRGASKGEALRRAQNSLSRVPEFASPRYWAAFQLVGAN